MATWAIGDVQGCLSSLDQLLGEIAFRPEVDKLWLVGDLVGRGPDPCGVLDLLISLEERAVCVLGNHDLHLIAASFELQQVKAEDNLSPILQHPDRKTDLLSVYQMARAQDPVFAAQSYRYAPKQTA